MEQVNNCLPFEVETPDDRELHRRFFMESIQDVASDGARLQPTNKSPNALKRKRKAQRKARAKTRG